MKMIPGNVFFVEQQEHLMCRICMHYYKACLQAIYRREIWEMREVQESNNTCQENTYCGSNFHE